MTLSIIPEVRQLQREAGKGKCPFCLRALRRKGGFRPPQLCWSADCRAALETARARWRRETAAALSRSVKAVGRSVTRVCKVLELTP